MKGKLVALLFACIAGLVAVGAAPAKAPPAKKKPALAKAKLDARFDCTKVAPAALFNSLVGGWGGTYGARNHLANASAGFSLCGYTQSGGWPWPAPPADAPASVVIEYGAGAAHEYRSDHTAAVEGVRCDKLKAQGATPDPRQCGPVAVAGLGNQAYEANDYVAVLRGNVFLQVTLHQIPNSDQTDNVQPPADLLVSVAKTLLAKLPTK